MINERFKVGLIELSKATLQSQVISTWASMGDSKKDKIGIISLEGYDKNIYPIALNKLINSEDSAFIPYFESGKLYFIDDELLDEMYGKRGLDVTFHIDYSVMLDTNYASYIDRFVNNINLSSLDNNVFTTIDILLREDFHFDYLFYIIENYKNAFFNSGLSNVLPEVERKAGVFQNLVSLELFKNIDKKEYVENGKIKYNISKQEAFLNVDDIFSYMFNSSMGKKTMGEFLDLHKSLVLFLIGVIRIRFQSKKSYHIKIRELFEYMDSTIGIFYQREMIVAHKYFINPVNVQLINKVNKGMTRDSLLKNIENFAWDFASPRIMEIFLKTRGEGRYFIPFFLSNDINLRNLLKLFKVKGVIFDKNKMLLSPIPSEGYFFYFKKNEPDLNTDLFFNNEAIKKREERNNFNKKNNFSCLEEEFSKLAEIMECK